MSSVADINTDDARRIQTRWTLLFGCIPDPWPSKAWEESGLFGASGRVWMRIDSPWGRWEYSLSYEDVAELTPHFRLVAWFIHSNVANWNRL